MHSILLFLNIQQEQIFICHMQYNFIYIETYRKLPYLLSKVTNYCTALETYLLTYVPVIQPRGKVDP